jgi:hypothetical protein
VKSIDFEQQMWFFDCVRNKKRKKPGGFEFKPDWWSDSMPAALAPIFLPAMKNGSVKWTIRAAKHPFSRRLSWQ